jgi:hypothetical protein
MKAKFFVFTVLILVGLKKTTAQVPDWLWAENASGNNSDAAASVSADAAGNIYVAGNFNSPSITFGATTLINSGSDYYDMFIVKYNSDGNVLWAKSALGNFDDFVNAVTADPGGSGDIYVAGKFNSSTLTLGSTTLINSGSSDMFIVKYDSDGNVLWAKNGGGYNFEEATSVFAGASGSIYVVGNFNSPSIIFGLTTLIDFDSVYFDMFIVKYDSAGNVLWAKSEGGGDNDFVNAVTADPAGSGDVYMTGTFGSMTLIIGSDTLTKAISGYDMFVVKYNEAGNALWAKNAGGILIEQANSVSADSYGNICVAGYFMSASITFDSITLTNSGSSYADMFVVKYDSAGNAVWAKGAGGNYEDAATAVAADPASGAIYVTGYFQSPTMTIGSTTLTNAGSYDVFIVNYDSAGNTIWAKSAGGSDLDEAVSVAANPSGSGESYVAGYFTSSSIPFGSTTLINTTGPGYTDMFIAKLSSTFTGIENQENSSGINIYPNPSNGKFTIERKNSKRAREEGVIEIYNVIAEKIYGADLQQLNNAPIDISDKPGGIYFLIISSGNEKKIIKVQKL